jgi:hypothetical protein
VLVLVRDSCARSDVGFAIVAMCVLVSLLSDVVRVVPQSLRRLLCNDWNCPSLHSLPAVIQLVSLH